VSRRALDHLVGEQERHAGDAHEAEQEERVRHRLDEPADAQASAPASPAPRWRAGPAGVVTLFET